MQMLAGSCSKILWSRIRREIINPAADFNYCALYQTRRITMCGGEPAALDAAAASFLWVTLLSIVDPCSVGDLVSIVDPCKDHADHARYTMIDPLEF
jgi:hypothetical protein